jgi:hypothetical protein
MNEIKVQLEAELAEVRAAIEASRHQAKHAVGDDLALEAVETELRSLRTRLRRLEVSHKKLAGDANC